MFIIKEKREKSVSVKNMTDFMRYANTKKKLQQCKRQSKKKRFSSSFMKSM